jgi:hypothetical protein
MSETPPEELEGLPASGPATLGGVKARSKITDTDDDADLEVLVAAVNAKVRRWPVCRLAADQEEFPGDVVLGADMLGARLWRRRDTPSGVEIFGADAIAYVQRNDPDVAMLLELGDWSKPAVG